MHSPLSSGTKIGRYEIRSKIGEGGMGEVYLAQDTQLDRIVALKILPAEVVGRADRLHRFTQEAKAASALNHPNILTIFEVGETSGTHFIATEFIDGETLRQRLKGHTLDLGEVLSIAAQVADALSSAHEASILHRDVKPENIMVRRRDGYVKLLDFGLAKLTGPPAAIDAEAATRPHMATDPGVLLGTVQYMSPEQARGQDVDARTDIFSLGVVLYEMIAGCLPFAGKTNTDVLAAIVHSEPPPLARYSREVPETLEFIVTKALRKDKEERYQTARELFTDLRTLKQRLEFAAEQERSQPPSSRSEAAVATSIAEGSAKTIERPEAQTESITRPTTSAEYLVNEVKRHKRAIVLALIALVLVAGVALALRYKFFAKREEPFSKIKLTRLTASGKARYAAISPDGKYIAHVMGDPTQQSIWLRHIATGSDKEIAPSIGVNYFGTVFSGDGNYVYYGKQEGSVPSLVYQMPVLGGTARLISEDVDSQPALSPDGKRMAFFRGYPAKAIVEFMVANVDGSGERKLATYDILNFFAGGGNIQAPAWSPDGEVIITRSPASDANGLYSRLMAVREKDGSATPITSERWSTLGQFAWLPDGKGFIFTASDQGPGSPLQVWYASYPGGQVRRITNDLSDYRGVSLTADSSAFVTVPFQRFSSIWMTAAGDQSRAAEITTNKSDGFDGVVFAPDGRVVYTSRTSGNSTIWIANPDGTGQKQLTADAHLNIMPIVSPDGRYVVFVSDRAGQQNIWRMDIDGGNTKQLTRGQSDRHPTCSRDSQWVVYTSSDAGNQRVSRVPIEGGNPEQLTDYTSAQPVVSPDGTQIVCGYFDDQAPRWRGAIVPIVGGKPTKIFDIAGWPVRLRWASDGRAVTYIVTRAGVSNIWSQPLDDSKPVPLTDFKSDQIFSFDWSRDGKQLALARGNLSSDVVLISEAR